MYTHFVKANRKRRGRFHIILVMQTEHAYEDEKITFIPVTQPFMVIQFKTIKEVIEIRFNVYASSEHGFVRKLPGLRGWTPGTVVAQCLHQGPWGC